MAAKKRYLFRYLLITLVFCTVCVFYVGRLFYIQIAGRDQVLDDGTRTVTVKMMAVRGDILDRNGEKLVSNRYTYDLTLSFQALSTLGVSGANQTYLKLFDALDACGAGPTHEEKYFPFHGTYPNYAFSEDAKNPDTAVHYRLMSILKGKGMKETASEADIVAEYTDAFRLLEVDGKGKRKLSDYQVDRLLRLHYDMDAKKFNESTPYRFAENADIELMTYVRELGLRGVSFEVSANRVYHHPGYASHILGSVGPIYAEEWEYYNDQGYPMNATVGKSGCEAAFESYLRGTDGELKITLDAFDNIITKEVITEPVSGKDVYLTLDIRLQKAAEDSLKENVEYVNGRDSAPLPELSCDAGAAVAMNPKTFEILAIASYPTYRLDSYHGDYNELASNPARPLVNRALMETYAPGSTFKVGVALAGLKNNIITPSTLIACNGVYTRFEDYHPTCSTYPHGSQYLNVTKAIADSCNCFFYELGYRMGIVTVDEVMAKLGFGRKTGVELGEASGVLAGEDGTYVGVWQPGNTVQAAIGQSDTKATPLQICAYLSTVVNGGTRYAAHLLSKVSEYGGEPVYRDEELLKSPLDRLEFSDQTKDTLFEGMYQMVSESGGVRRFLNQAGVKVGCVGGKTGTAQIEKYLKDEATGETVRYMLTNALFMSFYSPAGGSDVPELAVSVVLEKAAHGWYASMTAAGIFAQWEDIRGEYQ